MGISPTAPARFEIEYENYRDNVERYYFFLTELLKDNFGYEVSKVGDTYTSSETSSFFGNIEARKGAQQDRASQLLATIGGMIKSLLQILHDLRIMEQRMRLYEGSKKGEKSAELQLKSLWVDMVEGGGQNASSVIGLAQKVGFVTLPDLFFEITPKTPEDVDKVVENVKDVNDSVKRVLKMKLRQFLEWKQATDKEIDTRWNFTLKYLRQHYNAILLQLNWAKPYIKNVKKLQAGETLSNVDLITSSEGAVVDLEILGVKKRSSIRLQNVGGVKGDISGAYNKFFPAIFIKIHWRARAMLRDEYQRTGAIHLGRANIKFYNYVLTQEEIDNYQKEKEKEDMELLSAIDASLEALKGELKHRLEQAGEAFPEEKEAEPEEKPKKRFRVFGRKTVEKVTAPVASAGKKAKDISSKTVDVLNITKKQKKKFGEEEEFNTAAAKSGVELKIIYEIFKKAHRMVQW